MSAPNQGRQSPDPERQSDAQQGATTTDVHDTGAAASAEEPKEASADQLKNLESNPKGVLEEEAEKKTAKS
ncbi:hypothetical protein K431DRAFT_281481 [Polychaeton citri CBS 116435]|uniref:Uncharacterized protein n=1 Tax=Polychaeton citri CBS 116435 TaxID=1314669 RepID=A0A9P4QFR8_9PEZI|nr:hypothetical protein K431DRAFT_281481 [Polychaeton citri CBS 116435]